jgi:hypothetical protein
MAAFKRPELVQPVETPQHFTPPTARERRAEAVQRLQVGLFGLAAMLLLVALANIIMERARLADAAAGVNSGAHAAGASSTSDSDPLADLGVIPSPASTPAPVRTSSNAQAATAH